MSGKKDQWGSGRWGYGFEESSRDMKGGFWRRPRRVNEVVKSCKGFHKVIPGRKPFPLSSLTFINLLMTAEQTVGLQWEYSVILHCQSPPQKTPPISYIPLCPWSTSWDSWGSISLVESGRRQACSCHGVMGQEPGVVSRTWIKLVELGLGQKACGRQQLGQEGLLLFCTIIHLP